MNERTDDYYEKIIDEIDNDKGEEDKEEDKEESKEEDNKDSNGKKNRPSFDWKVLTKEYVGGSFETVDEYIKWSDDRVEKFGEKRPTSHTIKRASSRFDWIALKRKKELGLIEKIVDGASNVISAEARDQIEELAKMKTAVTKSLVNLIIKLTKDPSNMYVRADLSDLINDTKRSLGMKTKEEDQVSNPMINVNQQNAMIGEGSRRKQLEEATKEEREKIAQSDIEINKALKEKFFDDEELADFE